MTVAPDLRAEALNCWGLILLIQRRLARRLNELQSPHGLIGSEFECLLRLARSTGEQLRMSDLAAQVGSSASGLTATVGRLEGAGLVRREPSPSDRRSFVVRITPKGRGVLDEALADIVPVLEQLILEPWKPDLGVVRAALERQILLIEEG